MTNVQVSEINGLKIYNLTGGRSLYDIMKESNFSYKKLKKNEEYVNRIEIIQDFQFPVSASCMKISNDGNFVFASGIYPPKLKLYDLNEMTLKCERGVDSEVRKIEIISDDYSKAALLCEDRNIEIHAQYGKHFKIRIPKYGRDMVYHKSSCDLFTVGSSNEVYRLNLYEGQFMSPLITSAESINACAVNYNLELLGLAGEKGIVELWDLRERKRVTGLPLLEDALYNKYDFSDVTAINFSANGLLMSVGNEIGKVNVYDLRNPKPLYTINHSYRLPIKKIKYHELSQNIITVDKKLAKFSNMKTGRAFTNIETKQDINDFDAFGDSGMFLFACEAEKMEIYFVPGIGPAPKWASFLENITEELEATKNYSVYEDYKFLTAGDLESMGATTLIGTQYVKPYMHGYFMDWKLYKKLKSVTDPFAYDKYMEERKGEKFKKMFGERIVLNRNKLKVNSKLAADVNTTVVQDERFKKLFESKDFEVDFSSEHFKSANPSKKKLDREIEETNNEEAAAVKEQKIESDKTEKIVNPELIKLKEKLLSKKRKKIDKLYSQKEEEFESALEERLNKKDDDDLDEFDIINKINRIENKMNKHQNSKKYKPKITNKTASDGKRILANRSKLTLTKIK